MESVVIVVVFTVILALPVVDVGRLVAPRLVLTRVSLVLVHLACYEHLEFIY